MCTLYSPTCCTILDGEYDTGKSSLPAAATNPKELDFRRGEFEYFVRWKGKLVPVRGSIIKAAQSARGEEQQHKEERAECRVQRGNTARNLLRLAGAGR